MAVALVIEKDGVEEQRRDLAPGVYVLGRSDAVDVTLQDRSISGKHAQLSVKPGVVEVLDLDSTNGVLLQGKRVKKKTLKSAATLAMGAYVVRVEFPGQKTAPSKSSTKGASSLNPRFLVYGAVLVAVLLTSMAVSGAVNAKFSVYHKRETLKRGIMLVRYLGAMNLPVLMHLSPEEARVSPTAQEEGVAYAYIIDPHGKILAPLDEVGKFLEKPKLSKALEHDELLYWPGDEGEHIFFTPITGLKGGEKTLLGAAVLGYDLKRAGVGAASGAGSAFFAVVFCLVVALVMAWCVLRFMLKPLRALSEDAGVALKDRRDHIEFKAGYGELRALVEIINRALLRVSSLEARQGASEESGAPPTSSGGDVKPAPEPVVTPEPVVAAEPDAAPTSVAVPEPAPEVVPHPQGVTDAQLAQETAPWCVIDLEQYVILAANQPFQDLLGNTGAPPEELAERHMLEVFSDPVLLNMVSKLLDSDDPETDPDADLEAGAVKALKQTYAEADNAVVFIFQEA